MGFNDCSESSALRTWLEIVDRSLLGCDIECSPQLIDMRLQLLKSVQVDDDIKRNRWRIWRHLTESWCQFCWPTNSDTEPEIPLSSEALKELSRQIVADVNRSYNHIDAHISLGVEEKSQRKAELTDVLLSLYNVDHKLDDEYELQYLQGSHEVCAILMDVYKQSREGDDENLSTSALKPAQDPEFMNTLSAFILSRLTNFHSRVRFDVGVYMSLGLILELLRNLNFDAFRRICYVRHSRYRTGWEGDGSELHFSIPWLVTLFAHSIKSWDATLKIWDTLIAFPPPFLIYFVTAVIETILPRLDAIQDNHNDLDISCEEITTRIFPRSVAMLKQYPYDALYVTVTDKLSSFRDFSENKVYFDAQSSIYDIMIPRASVIPSLYAPILEWRRAYCVKSHTGESVIWGGYEVKKMPKKTRVIGERISERVTRLCFLDGWFARVARLSHEWQWLLA